MIIDLSEAHKKGEQLFQSLRATYPEMPIGAISNPNQPTRLKFTRVISPSTPTDMWCEILSFCVIDCGFRTDSIYTPTLTVSKNAVFYMCEKLPLAPRQHRILQCLAYRAPRSVSTDDLLSLCYPVEPRSVSNLAVQIREINRRAAAINAPPLILSTYATGYRIRNGIFEETLSKE